MDVVALRTVASDRVRGRDQVQRLERAQRAEVEDRAEVDEEALLRWPAKTLPPNGSGGIAAATSDSYAGVERGPMRTGGVGSSAARTLRVPGPVPDLFGLWSTRTTS